jgi:hypothetical protein
METLYIWLIVTNVVISTWTQPASQPYARTDGAVVTVASNVYYDAQGEVRASAWINTYVATNAEVQAQILAAQAAAYPTPDVTVPMVDTNGTVVGTARIVVDRETLETIAVINTASPQRPWQEQRTNIVKKVESLKANKGKAKSGLTDKQKADIMWEWYCINVGVTNAP